MLISSRALIRVAAGGVVLSALATAATFTRSAADYAFVRYPLLGAATALVVMAGWSSTRLESFNRTLWAHAPWWARLAWLVVLAAAMAAFASITLDPAPTEWAVLEARGISAVAAYLFFIAALRGNVDESQATEEKATN